MLETLDAAALRRWCAGGLAALRRHQGEIDELNVYPVPDGDTGTNLVLTMTSAHQALALDNTAEGDTTAHGRVLRLMARGALLGARGNSGVIVAQLLRGLADALGTAPAVDGPALAAGLRAAAAAAYTAVATPVEGTVLTVAAAAAEAAGHAATGHATTGPAAADPAADRARYDRARRDRARRRAAATRAGRAAASHAGPGTLAEVVRAAAAAAAEALARTPEQLPALARAGVVDAGGRGLCVLLDALVEVVTGEHVDDQPAPPGAPPGASPWPARRAHRSSPTRSSTSSTPTSRPSGGSGTRSTGWATRWSSSARRRTWNVHVHVNDVGAAIEAGVAAGRPHQISVTRFDDAAAAAPAARAAVVVAAGAGLVALFGAEGARVVGGNPSTGELLAAIRGYRRRPGRGAAQRPRHRGGGRRGRRARRRPPVSGSASCRPARRCRPSPRSPSATRPAASTTT